MNLRNLYPKSDAEAERERKERDQEIRIQIRNLERANAESAKAVRVLKETMGMQR